MISNKIAELNMRYERLYNTLSYPLLPMNLSLFCNYLRQDPCFASFVRELDHLNGEAKEVFDYINDAKHISIDCVRKIERQPEIYPKICWNWIQLHIENLPNEDFDTYDDTFWLTYSNVNVCSSLTNQNKQILKILTDYSVSDKIKIFVSGVVAPIVNYITDNQNSRIAIEFLIDSYISRLELRKYAEDFSMNDEIKCQSDFAVYLHDQGQRYSKEPQFGNGKADFILEVDGADYAIEVKYAKENKGKTKDATKWYKQLKAYMTRFQCKFGCLLVFNNGDTEYLPMHNEEDIVVKNVQLTKINPSKNNTKTIRFPIDDPKT